MHRRDVLKTLMVLFAPAPAMAQNPSVSTLIGTGSAGYSDQQVNNPYGLVIGPDGALYFCLLEWETPLPVDVRGSGVRPAMLHCLLRLGDPAGPRPGPDLQNLTTTLHLDGHEFRSGRMRYDFEEALRDIQRALPRAARLRACVSCAWSDYSPLGNGLRAGLACFRDAKDRYRRVDAKHGPTGIFAIWDDLTEFVQETWLCPEFEHRGTHKGYRGTFP